ASGGQRAGPERLVVGEAQRARERRAARIGVDPRQREHAGADLDQAAGAGDRPGERGAGVVVARGERSRSQGHTARAGERADALIEAREIERGAARDRESATWREGIRSPGLQRAGTDRGGPPICIVGGEDRRARAVLLERAGARDEPAEGEDVGAIDGKDTVVGHVADDRAARSTIAEL